MDPVELLKCIQADIENAIHFANQAPDWMQTNEHFNVLRNFVVQWRDAIKEVPLDL